MVAAQHGDVDYAIYINYRFTTHGYRESQRRAKNLANAMGVRLDVSVNTR